MVYARYRFNAEATYTKNNHPVGVATIEVSALGEDSSEAAAKAKKLLPSLAGAKEWKLYLVKVDEVEL